MPVWSLWRWRLKKNLICKRIKKVQLRSEILKESSIKLPQSSLTQTSPNNLVTKKDHLRGQRPRSPFLSHQFRGRSSSSLLTIREMNQPSWFPPLTSLVDMQVGLEYQNSLSTHNQIRRTRAKPNLNPKKPYHHRNQPNATTRSKQRGQRILSV